MPYVPRPARAARAAMVRRELPIAAIPGRLVAYVLTVDVAVAIASLLVVAFGTYTSRDLGILALLAFIAVGFEEGANRVGRLTLRFSKPLKRDMISVWVVAAAVSLSAQASVILLVVVYVFLWFRQHRTNGQPLYRTYFTASSAVAGCLLSGMTVRWLHGTWGSLPWAAGSSLAVVVAIVVFTIVNRSLVTIALVGVGVRGRELLGSRDENLTETATLCLGGLVAVAAVNEPWLCLLVLIPMVVLQRAALVRELETAAITDAKTGLLNAVTWEQLARRELLRAQRVNARVAVLIIDVDRFKVVNDRFGHLAGDKVLAGIARATSESLRGYDGLGRFGGEEFVAVLPDADERGALVIAERVRIRVNQLRIGDLVPEVGDDAGGADLRLSVSIGVAVLNADGVELPELLHAADQALYRAKWNGRNQVQLARRGDQLPDMVNQ